MDKPTLKGLGGARSVSRKLKGSDVIWDNRENLALQLLGLASANITDVVDWGTDGEVKLKRIHEIPDHALASIKRIRSTPHGLDIEMVDKVRVLQLLAKSAGLLDRESIDDKPAVIDIKMVGPSDG